MKRYLCCSVSYLGKAYSGWQSQKDGSSIQENIEQVLSRIEQRAITIVGSGRTDAGVSAFKQVFMFESEKQIDTYHYLRAINTYLPDDIFVSDMHEVNAYFHPRHNVKHKTYVYRIMQSYNVFLKDYACYIPQVLDVEKMEEASKLFVGKHDFTSLNTNSLTEYPNQVRRIIEIRFSKHDGQIDIYFTGKGFLRYMVRMMAGLLIDVGLGKITKDDVRQIMLAKSKQAYRKTAVAKGLTLADIAYFDVIGKQENTLIRQVVYDDFECLSCLQVNFLQQRTSPKVYVISDRFSQTIIGLLLIGEKKINLYETSQIQQFSSYSKLLDMFEREYGLITDKKQVDIQEIIEKVIDLSAE